MLPQPCFCDHSGFFALYEYCKFENFRDNFLFAKSVKRHIHDVKELRTGHDLPISVNDSDIANSRGFDFHET